MNPWVERVESTGVVDDVRTLAVPVSARAVSLAVTARHRARRLSLWARLRQALGGAR